MSREVLLAEHDCLRRSDIMAMKEMRGGEYLAAIRKRVMSHKPLVDDLVRLLLSALVWLLKLCTASRSIHTYVCAALFFSGFRIRIGSGFNRVSRSGTGSRRTKMTYKYRIFFLKFMFLSVGLPLLRLRAEGFFCNLHVLYGGLGVGKL
jgi:hypothetical protein